MCPNCFRLIEEKVIKRTEEGLVIECKTCGKGMSMHPVVDASKYDILIEPEENSVKFGKYWIKNKSKIKWAMIVKINNIDTTENKIFEKYLTEADKAFLSL